MKKEMKLLFPRIGKSGFAGQMWPVPVFAKVFWRRTLLIRFCIAYDCFHAVTAELSTLYSPDGLKYVFPGVLPKVY